MEHSFEVRASQRDADIALRRFILRSMGWGMLIAVLLCVAYLIYDFGNDFGSNVGPLSIAIIVLLTILVVVPTLIYIVRRRQIATLIERLGDTPVIYRLDETEFAIKSSLGGSTLKWEMLKQLWINSDVIMVFYAQNGYVTASTDQVPAAALEFMVAKIKGAGGKILDKR